MDKQHNQIPVENVSMNVYECVYTGDHISGIIAFLTRECGGNVHDLGIVEVMLKNMHDLELAQLSHSATEYLTRPLKFLHSMMDVPLLVDYPWHVLQLKADGFCALTGSGSWICYDFKQFRVVLSSYSIRIADVWLPPSKSIRSWVIEVSRDKITWLVVDQRENIDCSGASIQNFPCIPTLYGGLRYVRLRQTGENDTEIDLLAISALEFFGTLFIERS